MPTQISDGPESPHHRLSANHIIIYVPFNAAAVRETDNWYVFVKKKLLGAALKKLGGVI